MKRLFLAILAMAALTCAFSYHHAAHAGAYIYDAGPADGLGTSPSAPNEKGGIIIANPKEGGVIVGAVATIDPEKDPGGAVSSVLNAAKGGQWRLLAGLLLSLLVWAARRWGSSAIPWLKTDRGGAALVLLLSLLGGVATTLAGDTPFAWGLLANSLSMAFTAAGGFVVVKKILAPSDKAVP